MQDEAAFIRAMVASPDDDTPRLVYADWLDERGQSARAEFIRIQIELARSLDHSDQVCLRAREAQLLEAHEGTWAPNNALCLFFQWRRGFVAALHPAARGVFDGEDSLKLLAEFPLAEELQIGFCMTDAEFRHLPVLPNLRSLSLGGNVRLTNDALRRVGKWKTLRRLSLTCDRVSDVTLSHLAGLTELRALDVSFSAVTDAGLPRLTGLKALEELDLSESSVTGRGLFALGGLPRLRVLNLTNSCYFDPGINGLGVCRALEELRLGSRNLLQPIEEADVTVLQGLPGLRVLDLGGWGEVSDTFIKSMHNRLPAVEVRYAGARRVPAVEPDCAECEDFRKTVRIGSPDELFEVLGRARSAMLSGVLRVVSGNLDWSDLIECEFGCAGCGSRFQLTCETYHGAGGEWQPAEPGRRAGSVP